MKLYIINKTHHSIAITLPKKLLEALNWVKGDRLEATLGKDRSIVLKKIESGVIKCEKA